MTGKPRGLSHYLNDVELAPPLLFGMVTLGALAVIVKLIGWGWTAGIVAVVVFCRVCWRGATRIEAAQAELIERRMKAQQWVDQQKALLDAEEPDPKEAA